MTTGGTRRLPPPFGTGLDRSQPLVFTFEGAVIDGFEGDTIASALLANGVDLISRSFKYHRPRSVLGLDGGDANGLVTVDGVPNLPAELTPATNGSVVTAQNFRGSLRRDRWATTGWFRRFLPVGFYYWAFHRPRFLWPLWERMIRKRAGLGAIDVSAPHQEIDKEYLFADVAVIGGGPAGLAAAIAAADAGAQVILLERGPCLGTQDGGDAGAAANDPIGRLAAIVEAHDRIDCRTGATCTGIYADNWLAAVAAGRLLKLRARQVVLATGTIGQGAVFRRNDLPGIMLASAAMPLVRTYGVAPGTRAVILTTGESGYAAANLLHDAGVIIAGVVDTRSDPSIQTTHPRHDGMTVVEARGHRRIRGVKIGPVADPFSGNTHLACDLLVMDTGAIPAGALWCQAGGRLAYDNAQQSLVLDGQPPGMVAAGSVNGAIGTADSVRDGKDAGTKSAAAAGVASTAPADSTDLGTIVAEVPETGRSGPEPLPIVPHPRGLEFVDLDEDLTVHDLTDGIAQGFDHAQLLKRYSTLGMGPSQGRHALLAGMLVTAAARGAGADEVGHTTVRPPASGVRFDTLAGRGLHPERRTPMDALHRDAGAQMMPAGTWWRPAVYAPGARPDRTETRHLARTEARHVRTAAGLIDVSTLGKLELRGPEAAAFLERIYTFRYAKQPVGRSRYLLMTDEAGYVIDDGVACRLEDAHFYVTTTTGASDQVYRAMLFWNAQWRMEVDITNVTGAYAAVNLAGPRSREILREVAPDLDLSADGFPYLAVRAGNVAGVPARLFRVGFVGELGYEIHVAAGHGAHLWGALTAAGGASGLKPFGVEAQRLLRLEKGHVIVGQDTDGLTHPSEAGLGWAVADKPYFVGDRATGIHEQRPATRTLVGFRSDLNDDLFPEENHLVVRGDEITGRIASSGIATQSDEVIGLAWVAPDQSAAGSDFTIKVAGQPLTATVIEIPAYDPENARQEIAA